MGYEDRDNLGLRYLLSSAREAGFTAGMTIYDSDPRNLIEIVERDRPDVIGFSLIFQYMAPDFARVIAALRERGVAAHVTMGGHYPSFDPSGVLRRIPGLDSVVRFEGERTLVDLLDHVARGEDWRGIEGIAYRAGDAVTENPLRAPIEDLDTLPRPAREGMAYAAEWLPTASILASRGCPWDCSFCSIRPFYEAQGGALRRMRRPDDVVAEMADLHHHSGVTCFLFQDDDFLAGGRRAREWACKIADGVVAAGLADRIAFKISCRSDEIDEETCRRLMAGGLTHVYMGVESGDAQGLLNMSKRIKPDEHLEAGRVLKKLGLSFDFGFMLLEPYTMLAGVRNNVDFLEAFVGDGWTVATFCRTLPYAGTPLEARMRREGRLLGTAFEPDYRFLDPKLDHLYDWMLTTFHERNFTNAGLGNILRSLVFEARLRLPGQPRPTRAEAARLQALTAVCNRVACYTLRSALDHIEATPLAELERDRSFLEGLTRHERAEERRLLREVADLYWTFRRRHPRFAGSADMELLGGFEKTWTAA